MFNSNNFFSYCIISSSKSCFLSQIPYFEDERAIKTRISSRRESSIEFRLIEIVFFCLVSLFFGHFRFFHGLGFRLEYRSFLREVLFGIKV